MKKKEFWKLSVLNVLSTPLRSALTIAGFAVGVAAILAVLTLGDAGKNEVVREMGRLGIDKIWVSAKESRGLPRGCGEELAKLTGAAATEHSYLLTEVQNANGDRKTTTAAGMHELSEIKLKEGRLPCAQEWENSGSAALVGEALAAELDLSPGCVVTAFGRTYRICGIARASESVASVPLEEALILPLEEISAISGGMISEIRVKAPSAVSIGQAEKLVRRALLWQNAQADVMTMEIQMEAATGVTDTFVSVLRWVAFVCVLVGGIGVMNILLVSVRERKREIGVMKSLGTTPGQICMLFLLEALVYAAFGGILGLMLGMMLIRIAGYSIQLPASAAAGDCLMVFAASLTTGLIFGVMPALRASMMKCVDALRQE